jgi:hypothetical protein
VQGPGENAGAIDIGDGSAVCVFKIESHNHPSSSSPSRARPPAWAASPRHLHHGRPAHRAPRCAALRRSPNDGRATAASSRASSPALPTTATASAFRPSAANSCSTLLCRQPLVNVLSPRPRPHDRILKRPSAHGVGNPVYYVGAKTGRDGIHGATMASAEFDEESGGEAAQRAGGRSVHGKAAARSLPGSHEDRRARRHPGHGRGRADLFHLRDGLARQLRMEIECRSCRSAKPA